MLANLIRVPYNGRLTTMKIAAVDPYCLRLPGVPGRASDLFAVRVRSDNGTAGWGESTAAPLLCLAAVCDPESGLRGLLTGEPLENPDDIRRLHEKLTRQGPGFPAALGAVDIALWDLLGRLLDQPVYRLLDGAQAVAHPRAAAPPGPPALDIASEGGLTPLHRLRGLARSGGAPFFVRASGSGIGLAAALHLLASEADFGTLEDASASTLLSRSLASPRPVPDAQGLLHVPAGPGLGVVPDPETLRLNVHPVKIERAARVIFQQPAP